MFLGFGKLLSQGRSIPIIIFAINVAANIVHLIIQFVNAYFYNSSKLILTYKYDL